MRWNQLLLGLATLTSAEVLIENPDWELIGSRTYNWRGDEELRCRHWDKVAIRWHFCPTAHMKNDDAQSQRCEAGIDWAGPQEDSTSILPSWHNAFTYVHLPNQTDSRYLRLAVPGMGKDPVEAISPLRIDLDWRWTADDKGCNQFSVRMSALSTIEKARYPELERFCRRFDLDRFVDCHNL